MQANVTREPSSQEPLYVIKSSHPNAIFHGYVGWLSDVRDDGTCLITFQGHKIKNKFSSERVALRNIRKV